jgi:hypothetical protein
LCEQSCAALHQGARGVGRAVYDERGYAPTWTDNLLRGLPLDVIRADFAAAAGQELNDKFRAAYSSAALVVNTFGCWREHPETLAIAGLSGFRKLRFEAQLPTGLQGKPPHLDVLAEGGETILAIESKCTEWIAGKPAKFSVSYDSLEARLGHTKWFNEMQQLRRTPRRYSFLDAAQLFAPQPGRQLRFEAEFTKPG